MAGHGRRISPSDEGERSHRTSLPLSLTSRLHSNTWRQVFTSLRPLVSQTRQRTLSTYARRLHQRQQDSATRRSQLEEPTVQNSGPSNNSSPPWQPLMYPSPPHGITNTDTNNTRVEANNNLGNTVIEMETGNGHPNPLRHSTIPAAHPAVLPQPMQIEQRGPAFVSTDVGNSGSEAVLQNPPERLFNSPVDSEPLLPGSPNEGEADDEGGTGTSGESITEFLSRFPEIRSALVVVWQYCFLIVIIMAKAVFDHFSGLVVIITLVFGFLWSNNVLKKAVACQGQGSLKPLLVLLITLPAGVFLLYYNYRSDKLFYSVLLIPPDRDGLGVMDLMWIVIVSDYVLKLVTVFIKTLVTLMPHRLMDYQKRGKYFLLVEMVSQLYRSVAPIQPWISYLMDGYAGPKKVFGVFLSATYMVCKGSDIVTKMKSLQVALVKFMNSMNYGCTPSQSQLADAGNLCPICHDGFHLPIMLRCKHIFCEQCVQTWFDRERTCPLCRTQIADDPAWRDGGTSHFL